jgi:hypothetical protein
MYIQRMFVIFYFLPDSAHVFLAVTNLFFVSEYTELHALYQGIKIKMIRYKIAKIWETRGTSMQDVFALEAVTL